jgi:alpha-beta hydrolase superfamily lysophospholipase
VLYVVILIIVHMFKERLILPGRQDSPITPAAAGIAFEEVSIPVDGTTRVRAWWIPAAEASTRRTVLYFHGNYETLETEATVEAPLWHATGANVLLVEFRGYGGSSPLQATAATTNADAQAALQYLVTTRQVPLADIVLSGRSIGASVVTRLAVEKPGAAALILITPITSINDAANTNWVYRVPLRPAQWFSRSDPFSVESRITSVHMPLTVIAGGMDKLAPKWMSERIVAIANEPKSLAVIDQADHNDIMMLPNTPLMVVLKTAVGVVP